MQFFLQSFTSYFVIIDPISVALIFYGLTSHLDAAKKRKTAIQAFLVSLLIILAFALVGESVLTTLGISMHALRVAGGILLFHTAFNMITKAPGLSPEQMAPDVVVYPLSIPLMAGPATLTLTVLLMSRATTTVESVAVLTAATIVLMMTLIASLASRFIYRVIGTKGDEVLRRLLGVVLAALAIEFIANGTRHLMFDAFVS